MKKQILLKALGAVVLLFVALTINATTYTVTSTANGTTTDGVSLRWAITQANSAAGNSIAFNISGAAPHTITLTSALPAISKDNITIDGSTQPANGYTGASPKIIINGNNSIGKGIEVSSTKDGIKVYGLYIKGFTDYAIYFPGKEAHIIGAVGKGNVISGNGNASTDAGIYVKGATIKANIIGMDVTGTIAEPNAGYGIQAVGGVVIIGGGTEGEGNLISANINHGIFLNNCDNSVIKGNKIGTDITGTLRFGNEEGSGIYMISGSSGVIIGGSVTGEENIISGNGGDGIYNSDGNNVVIKGNKIGTDITGTQNIGNTGNGIYMTATANTCIIGGNGSGEGNIISGNGSSGIYLDGPDFTIIKGNKIGEGIASENIGNNAYGIYITNSSHDNQIGGISAGDANIIAYNGNSGVAVNAGGGGTTDANKIQRNSIFCNASASGANSFGIQLIANGNDGLPAPVITSANATTISGTSVPNATIELFQDNDGCVGFQGKTYLGTTTANGSGNWTITGTFPNDITATATTDEEGTSPFERSPNLPPDPASPPPVCNFIRNPDLELGIPVTAFGQITFATFWDKGSSVSAPGGFPPSPDLFDQNSTTCATLCYDVPNNTWTGATTPLNDPSGKTRYAGIAMTCNDGGGNPRFANDERIRGQLTSALNAGCYSLCFKTAGTNSARTGANQGLSRVEAWLTSSSGQTRFLVLSGSVTPLVWNTVCVNFTITAADAGVYDYVEFRLRRPNPFPTSNSTDYFLGAFLDDFSLVTITADAGPDKIACAGQNTVIGAPTCPFPGATYSWSPGGLTGITVTVNPAVNTTYTVTATAPNGCTATDEVIVTVAPSPAISVVFPQICIGECATISPTVTGGTTPYTYAWSTLGNPLGTTLNLTVCPTNSTSYRFTVTDANGCQATRSIIVSVRQKPTIDAGADQSICEGACASLSATAGGVGQFSYVWSDGQTGATISVCPTTTTGYTVTVTSGQGCTNTDAITVTVANSGITINTTDQIICSGSCATVTASVSGGTSPYTYLWNTGQSTSSINVCPTVTTQYTVTVTDAGGCADSRDVEVEVLPAPTLTTYTVTNAGCDNDLKGTFTANDNDINGDNPFTYLWSTGATTLTLTGLNAGTYTLTITDANGCSANQVVTIGTQNPCPDTDDPLIEFQDCEIWIECQFFYNLPAGTLFWFDIWPVATPSTAAVVYNLLPCTGSNSEYSDAFAADPLASHLYPTPLTDPDDFANVNDISANCETGMFRLGFIDIDNINDLNAPGHNFYMKGATYKIRFHILDQATGIWFHEDGCVPIGNDPNDCLNYRPNTGNGITPSKDDPTRPQQSTIASLQGKSFKKEKISSSEPVFTSSVNVYPNPNNGNMTFDYTVNAAGELQITDVMGRQITTYSLKEGNHSLSITENELRNGVYFYNILINGETVKTDRLIIIK